MAILFLNGERRAVTNLSGSFQFSGVLLLQWCFVIAVVFCYCRAVLLLLRSQCGFGPYPGRVQCRACIALYCIKMRQCNCSSSNVLLPTQPYFPAARLVAAAAAVIVIDLQHTPPHHCNAVKRLSRQQEILFLPSSPVKVQWSPIFVFRHWNVELLGSWIGVGDVHFS